MDGLIGRVCAIVVTYNREKDLRKCLDGLLAQTRALDAIIIVDNASSDGTSGMLKRKGFITRDFEIKNSEVQESTTYRIFNGSGIEVVYIRKNSNNGGAGGFFWGSKRGYELGFEWLWLLDDDCKPDSAAFAKIISRANSEQVLNSFVINREDHGQTAFKLMNTYSVKKIISNSKNGLIEDVNLFNGTLIHRNIIDRIGLPNPDFFIYGDERDYLARMRQLKIPFYTIVDSKLYHPVDDERHWLRFLSLEIPVFLFEWKSYYRIRNRAYIHKIYNPFFVVILKHAKLLIAIGLSAVKCRSSKAFSFFYRAYSDGVSGKLGVRVQPGTTQIRVF